MVHNLWDILSEHVNNKPDHIAIIEQGRAVTYAQFGDRVLRCANGLLLNKINFGDRIFILAPVSTELYALLWAAFYLGLTPVFVDPSLSPRQVKRILKQHCIRAIFSVKKILRYRFLVPHFRRMRFFSFDSQGFGVTSMEQLFSSPPHASHSQPLKSDAEALLTFTTGSTGHPKGANRQFEILLNQHLLSQKYWPENPGEIDMPGFPMVTMQNLACGITTVLPSLLSPRPADINAAQVANDIDANQVTRLSGSPGFMKRLTAWLIAENRQLKSITRLIVGGAHVPAALAKDIRHCFPQAAANVVYGSTEAEPIAHVALDELIGAKTPGFLLGTPIAEINLKIVKLPSDDFLPEEFCKKGARGFESQSGEILIQGPHVIRSYIGNESANRTTKLSGPDGHWHRTGDYGFLDERGRLHLLGRSHEHLKVEGDLVPLLMIEKRLEEIDGVERAALVPQSGSVQVVIQGHETKTDASSVSEVLREFQLADHEILWTSEMPLDHRHNWKVDRAKLLQTFLK